MWLVWALYFLWLSQSWCCLSYRHISVCTATAERRTSQMVLPIGAHLELLCEVKHSTCSSALPGVQEDPRICTSNDLPEGEGIVCICIIAGLCTFIYIYLPICGAVSGFPGSEDDVASLPIVLDTFSTLCRQKWNSCTIDVLPFCHRAV